MTVAGLKGNLLPESLEDFNKDFSVMKFKGCVSCKETFSAANTSSPLGWKETQISGFCEKCFDNLFNED